MPAYIDYLAKCQKHLCASDTVNISMMWPRNLLYNWRAFFSLCFPIFFSSSLKRKVFVRFLSFSMYPGGLARAYKIIKGGLIKGKLYTASPSPRLISVQLPPSPMLLNVHYNTQSASCTKGFVQKENFLCSSVQLPNLLKYTVCASPSSTDICHQTGS